MYYIKYLIAFAYCLAGLTPIDEAQALGTVPIISIVMGGGFCLGWSCTMMCMPKRKKGAEDIEVDPASTLEALKSEARMQMGNPDEFRNKQLLIQVSNSTVDKCNRESMQEIVALTEKYVNFKEDYLPYLRYYACEQSKLCSHEYSERLAKSVNAISQTDKLEVDSLREHVIDATKKADQAQLYLSIARNGLVKGIASFMIASAGTSKRENEQVTVESFERDFDDRVGKLCIRINNQLGQLLHSFDQTKDFFLPSDKSTEVWIVSARICSLVVSEHDYVVSRSHKYWLKHKWPQPMN